MHDPSTPDVFSGRGPEVDNCTSVFLCQTHRSSAMSARVAESENFNEKIAEQQLDHGPKIPETIEINIPIIDFAGIDGPEHQKISQQIGEVCETWGFFHLINHGVDQALTQRAKDVSTEFLPQPQEKLKIKVQGPRIHGWNHSKHMVKGNSLIQKDTVEHLYVSYYPEREVNSDRFRVCSCTPFADQIRSIKSSPR